MAVFLLSDRPSVRSTQSVRSWTETATRGGRACAFRLFPDPASGLRLPPLHRHGGIPDSGRQAFRSTPSAGL